MTKSRLLSVLTAVLMAAGCSHEVESPKIGLTTLEPNLVCNDQRVGAIKDSAPVVLHGSGMTPLPTNVLAGKSILMLPQVDLLKSADLPGETSGAMSVTFSGDPKGNLANNLSWQSEDQMTVQITQSNPAVKLNPGLYDVTITNPDKHKKSSVAKGLAVVPPPSITSAEPVPQAMCTDQAPRQLVLNGKDFLVVGTTTPKVTLTSLATLSATGGGDAGTTTSPDGSAGGASHDITGADVIAADADCQAIPGTFAGGTVKLCTKLTVNLPAESVIPPGTYDVVVTSPDPADCESSEPTTVVIVPPPLVSAVVPPAVCVDQSNQVITVNGGSFAHVTKNATGAVDLKPTISITSAGGTAVTYTADSLSGCAAPPATGPSFGLELCDSLKFTVPAGALQPGSYKLKVTNPDPVGCTSTADIDFKVNAPPRVDGVNPTVVCSGGSTLVATGANIEQGATAELRCPSSNPTSTLPALGVVVSTDGTTATATFGPGAVPGVTCDFVVRNPDGCEDRPLPHKTVTGTEGPILFNVDPNFVYSNMDTSVKLYVTAIAGSFTVKMWPDSGSPTNAITLTSQLAPTKTNVVQAIIPKGTPVGAYTMQVSDQSGCQATMPSAVTVTSTLVLTSGTVEPPFGHSSESVPLTITLAADPGAAGAPRAFLTPTTGGQGIQLTGVTVTSATTLTAVVPSGTPAGQYSLVIVWPDGKVAVLDAAVTADGGLVTDGGGANTPVYTSVANAPPVISDATPQTVIDNSTPAVTITGSGFATDATVTFYCSLDQGVTVITHAGTVTTAPTSGCGTSCTMTATFDASTPGAGSVCVVRVTNPTDGTYGSFSAIGVTNSSNNLTGGQPSQPLNVARRALVAAAVKATSASRFVYAIGGDDGTDANAMDSVEFAPVSIYGKVSPWILNTMPNAPKLTGKRSYASTATVGRYIYVFGGYDGTAALGTGERTLVLSPEETPTFTDLDLCLAGGAQPCFANAALTGAGLDPGSYSYRVSANIDPTDAQNCGGETLASDPIILRLSNVSISGRKVMVKITWDTPRDGTGTPLTGVTGYNVYRTPKDGIPGTDEVLLATVTGASTLTFEDDGSQTLGTQKVLPLGSTSKWQATGNLSATRQGPAGAAGQDPADPTKVYVYALGGRDGATGRDSYEYLTVTQLSNGHQTVSATWTAPATSIGGARWQAAGWSVTNAVAKTVTPPDNFIYVGTGLNAAGASADLVTSGKVAAGGDLGTFTTGLATLTNYAGYGYCAIAGQLFAFGGRAFPPSKSSTICGAGVAGCTTPPPVIENWQSGLAMSTVRYLPGSAIQSAFIFFVGGQTATAQATTSTETISF